MKTILIAFMFLLSPFARATEKCFDFSVSMNSKELQRVRVMADISPEKSAFKAKVTGATADKSMTTSFDCNVTSSGFSCTQAGGDFSIDTTGPQPKMTFAYVNLAIGSSDPLAPKKGEAITEEFAFLDMAAKDEEAEEEAGHLEDTTIQGKSVACSVKF